MKPLKLKDRTVSLRMPSVADRLALNNALAKHRDRPALMARLEAAAIGLAWDSEQAQPPWQGGLAECGWDLIAFGEKVWKALEDIAHIIEISAQAWEVIAAILETLAPPKAAQEEARKNSRSRSARRSSKG